MIVLLVPVSWQNMPAVGAMRLAWMDAYQELSPRERRSAPAVIVAIDEASLQKFGQWPWPRTLVARLIDGIRSAGPAAIGVDILFPEPDRLSPEWLAPSVAAADPGLSRRLAALPHHDDALAASIRKAPLVLGIAGLDAGTAQPVGSPLAPSLLKGGDPRGHMRSYGATLRSLPEIDSAARGHGLLSAETENGVVRRVPMVALIGATPVLPLSLETLRVAAGQPFFAVRGTSSGVDAVEIGDLLIPTQPDGRLWVHYTPHDPARFVSAADVLEGKFDREQIDHKLVLIGVTGLGLIDYQTTPLGERMPGIEIHAQVLENVFDGSLLARPGWAPWAEGAVFLAMGLLVVVAASRFSPRNSVLLLVLLLGVLALAGLAAYRFDGILVDASVPGISLVLLFAAMLAETLTEANAQRRILRERLQQEREAAARLAGELDAARGIQMGLLPRPEAAFPSERRFEISASMEPAREVGGDLYDFFMLDADRLFFLIGDVSGKGLPASIFMAVSKALCKSTALRLGGRVEELFGEASTEIARENSQSLFVTAFAGVLDLGSGGLEYSSAGHDAPIVILPGGGIERLAEGGGPPLCVIEGFSYVAGGYRMRPGAVLCLFTDGVTEAMNAAGELYGQVRLRAAIERARGAPSAKAVVDAIREDVARFVAGAEPADDLTLLVLRWKGPQS